MAKQMLFISKIEYIYDATGVKLRKTVNGINTDYAEGRAFRKGPVNHFCKGASPARGQIAYTNANQNISTVDLEIVEENNYYPFGLKHKGYNGNITGRHHKYMFGGKELQDDVVGGSSFEMYDFGARNYDASLGRWISVDPLSQFPSPYNYTGNNPVNFIDPDGRYSYNWNTKKYENSNGEVVSWEEVRANNFEEPSQPEDIIFKDLTGKEVARYVTTEFKDEVIIPLYLSIGFSSIDLNKKYEGLDLDDLDAIGLSGGFGYYYGAGGGKSWSVVYFMDGQEKGTSEIFTVKSSGIGYSGTYGSGDFGIEFYNYLSNDDNFNSDRLTGVSYSISLSYKFGEIVYSHDSNMDQKAFFISPKTLLGGSSINLQSIKIGGSISDSDFGFSYTRNITSKGWQK